MFHKEFKYGDKVNFEIVNSKKIFSGKVIDLQVDEIRYKSTGNLGRREVAIHPGGSVVLPLHDNGKIILVSQYRYPMNEVVIELPAGKLDKGEDPFNAARRELKEETGFESNEIIKLGKIYSTPGFCTEVLHIYLAKTLIEGNHSREEGEESMKLIELRLDEIEEKIFSGEIVDAKTISGIFMYKLFLEKNK